MDVPRHKKKTIVRHEWIVGSENETTSARAFEDGMAYAKDRMEALGVKLGWDDAYYVRAGEGGEVIFYVDVEVEDKAPEIDIHAPGEGCSCVR